MAIAAGVLRAAKSEILARKGNAVLVLVLIAVGLFSVLSAYEKPFWYDEICTVIVCRLPGASEIWKALDHAVDTNPPLFYYIARAGRQLMPDDHLGYRLPSIVGLLVTVLCLYAFLARRVDRLSALVGASFVLCTPLVIYASDARPYALLLGCISAAILAWQRIDDSRLYSFALAITLAIALSVHYYAVLVWPAFVAAEASVWVSRRRFRAGTWIALVAGAAPLLIFAKLLLHLRQYYGQHFWAHPGLGWVFSAPSFLFNVLDHWGASLTIGAIVVLVWWNLHRALPLEDCVLMVMLLLLPAIAIAAATVSSGGMTARYMLPTILGGALAVGYLAGKTTYALRALLLMLMLVNYGLSSVPVVKKAVKGGLLEDRAAAARGAREVVARYREAGLPIVVSSGLQYLPMAYYMPPGPNAGLYALADPTAAVTFVKSDSIDRALLVLRQYYPLQVEDYAKFASRHREFILVSNGGIFDWWSWRLSQDGHRLSLLSADANARFYKVVLRPQMP